MKQNKEITFLETPMMLSDFERNIGIFFYDKGLLAQAFTHRSFCNENKGRKNYERLEFLGDAVIELIVTAHLYKKFPQSQEGELTNYRSHLVSTVMFGEIAHEIQMDKYVLLSRGQLRDSASARHILADIFEAFVAAVYLDQGYSAAENFISSYLFPRIHGLVERALWRDWKSVLQGKAQEEFKITPTYTVVGESGKVHERVFIMEVKITERLTAQGSGKSKAEAGKAAAKKLLALKGWL
jgi:ribonuclease-3